MHTFRQILLSGSIFATLGLSCNPLHDPDCVVYNPALSTALYDPLSVESQNFQANMEPPHVVYENDGASLTIFARGDNPQLISSKYIMYGRAEAEVKAAHGKSVISSMYMQSDDLDEIDIAELFGSSVDKFQTNYFVKGNVTNYDRDRYHKRNIDFTADFNKFAVEWTPDHISWFLNDRAVRKVRREHNPHGFPASPMRLKFSLWVGGDPDNHPGTIAWAGGEADFSNLPYPMRVRNVRLVDYSSGIHYIYGMGKDVESATGEIFGRKRSYDEVEEWEGEESNEAPAADAGNETEEGTDKLTETPEGKEESTGKGNERARKGKKNSDRDEAKEQEEPSENDETKEHEEQSDADEKFDQGISNSGSVPALPYSMALIAVLAFACSF